MSFDLTKLFPRMVGGCEETFFQQSWRKRTLLTESAVPELCEYYDSSRFIHDYRRLDCRNATLLVNIDRNGKRQMIRPEAAEHAALALDQQTSVVLQALLLPIPGPKLPIQWRYFLDLYSALREYLLPNFPNTPDPGLPVAAVDFFCSPVETSTGGHYDTGDVFYFVLEGEKEWTVELEPDYEVGLRLAAEGANSTLDRRALREHAVIRVKPGDCLYVPPYTFHRVYSRGQSLAVSIGLPTFSELSYFASVAHSMFRDPACYRPLPTYPATRSELCRAADYKTKAMLTHRLNSLFPFLNKNGLAEERYSKSA
jgi:ribosomal protein L16 Arg81 hydroxylase